MKVSKVVKYEANFAKGVLVTAEKKLDTVTETKRPGCKKKLAKEILYKMQYKPFFLKQVYIPYIYSH